MIQDFIRICILRLCKQPRTFEFISKNLNGLDPIISAKILRELEQEEALVRIDDLWVVKEIRVEEPLFQSNEPKLALQKYMGYFDFLKTPHPLDYEWRNSTNSLNRITNKIRNLIAADDKILLMGMPTLFATAIEKDIPNRVSLIERNKPIISGLSKLVTDSSKFKIIDADIFLIPPEKIPSHFCVIMDPPWYSPHFFQFMWLAAKCICVGGLVAISIPPINTRPDIMKERLMWFDFCNSLGLCLEALEPQQLEYATPFFEFNALRAGGINNILPFWRRGDLAIFRKITATDSPRPTRSQENMSWEERQYKEVRIRVLSDSSTANDETSKKSTDLVIETIIKGDILPTVSSRDERRKLANVWTSGNRIFRVNNPALFLNLLDTITRRTPCTKDEITAFQFVEVVNKLEKNEYDEYLNWVYYEMERQSN